MSFIHLLLWELREAKSSHVLTSQLQPGCCCWSQEGNQVPLAGGRGSVPTSATTALLPTWRDQLFWTPHMGEILCLIHVICKDPRIPSACCNWFSISWLSSCFIFLQFNSNLRCIQAAASLSLEGHFRRFQNLAIEFLLLLQQTRPRKPPWRWQLHIPSWLMPKNKAVWVAVHQTDFLPSACMCQPSKSQATWLCSDVVRSLPTIAVSKSELFLLSRLAIIILFPFDSSGWQEKSPGFIKKLCKIKKKTFCNCS